MSARGKIMAMFPASPVTAARVADEILAEHARELAEKIRTTDLPEIHVDMFDNGTQWAADLIDPDKGA
jgi:hypothetical protein